MSDLHDHAVQYTLEREDDLDRVMTREATRESIRALLPSMASNSVKLAAESILPDAIQHRVREMIDYYLPREVNRRVQAEAERRLGEVSNHMIATIDVVAQQRAQKLVSEQFPALAERHLKAEAQKRIPQLAQTWVRDEIQRQMPEKLNPVIKESLGPFRRRLALFAASAALVNVILLASFVALVLWKIAK